MFFSFLVLLKKPKNKTSKEKNKNLTVGWSGVGWVVGWVVRSCVGSGVGVLVCVFGGSVLCVGVLGRVLCWLLLVGGCGVGVRWLGIFLFLKFFLWFWVLSF